MARRSLFSILIIAAVVFPTLYPGWGIEGVAIAQEAQARPEPSRCLSLAQAIGASRVWWGQHIGTRERSEFFEWGPRKETFNDIGCFKTRRECEDWLSWKRADYPEYGSARPCRRGL
ncbi:hypothetical protein [uncultured Cohaesibacter sp.]|uniref:hypothetical protein n=1 Tax=uncultured Cohaesibacter sp. TaxID=1002546 RepID=UPI0029C835FD|nr:hypothetical protein [uncultured Cohaesibacter sp.]